MKRADYVNTLVGWNPRESPFDGVPVPVTERILAALDGVSVSDTFFDRLVAASIRVWESCVLNPNALADALAGLRRLAAECGVDAQAIESAVMRPGRGW